MCSLIRGLRIPEHPPDLTPIRSSSSSFPASSLSLFRFFSAASVMVMRGGDAVGGEAISMATKEAASSTGQKAAEILPVIFRVNTKMLGSKHMWRRHASPEALRILVRLRGLQREGCSTDAALLPFLGAFLTVWVAHFRGTDTNGDENAHCMMVSWVYSVLRM